MPVALSRAPGGNTGTKRPHLRLDGGHYRIFDVAHVKPTPVSSFAEDTQSFFVRRFRGRQSFCPQIIRLSAPATAFGNLCPKCHQSPTYLS
jgi:hypothetical protein